MNKLNKILVISVSLAGLIVFVSYSSLVKASSYNTGLWGSTAVKAEFTIMQPILVTDVTAGPDVFGLGALLTTSTSTTKPVFAGADSTNPVITMWSQYKITGSPGTRFNVAFPSGVLTNREGFPIANIDGSNSTNLAFTQSVNMIAILVTSAANGNACSSLYNSDQSYSGAQYYLMTANTNCTHQSTGVTTLVPRGTAYFNVLLMLNPKLIPDNIRGKAIITKTIVISLV